MMRLFLHLELDHAVHSVMAFQILEGIMNDVIGIIRCHFNCKFQNIICYMAVADQPTAWTKNM